jgi:hypothetical protein
MFSWVSPFVYRKANKGREESEEKQSNMPGPVAMPDRACHFLPYDEDY